MGLPLFVPPVESDVLSKPSTKCPADPSHARSPIRRADRRRQLDMSREQRLRILDTLRSSASDNNTEPSLLTTLQRASASGTRPPLPQPPADLLRVSGRQSPRLENPRISELTDLERRRLGRLTTNELSRSFAIDDLDDAWTQLSHVIPSHLQSIQSSLSRQSSALQVAARHRPGYTTRRAAWRRGADHDNEQPGIRRRRRDAEREFHRLTAEDALMSEIVQHQTQHHHAQRVRYVDGLGDRDRSLSPEGDGVWDTLQSTLTPDPQPPSVGSSFASTITSATTSEVNGSTSVNTSMTTPIEETEPPCDPVTDNPGSDGEDEVEERASPLSTPRGWRSYANVAAEAQSRQSTESADTSDPDREWLSGMHRIVRGLASRVDIPDEWWAQAGLSRSMSWEDTI
ncbi:hypothetical protein F5Y03DRAFT_90650 [Xylaria venustula]|nr:hypothetical protein F5Y03DRAFT_90650 [Xylaria venustula]